MFRYGSFFNAVITFVLIAAAIFFVVVKPYNMYMERRRAGLEAEPPAAKSDEVLVLEEIRDLMRTRVGARPLRGRWRERAARTGSVARTRVPARRQGSRRANRPSIASTRSRRPASPGPCAGVGAALAVVGDLDGDVVAPPARTRDRRAGAAGVLRDVGERLRGHEVERGLVRRRQLEVVLDVELDGHRRAVGERLQRRLQAAVGEDRRMDAARQLAQLRQRGRELGRRAVHERRVAPSSPTRLRIMRSVSESATRRCWAPSCRSRSSRRRAW